MFNSIHACSLWWMGVCDNMTRKQPLKKYIVLLVMFALTLFVYAATTATLSQVEKASDYIAFSTTGSHEGGTNTLTVSFPSGFEASDYNDTPITIVTSSSETTADSIRFTLAVKGKPYATGSTWYTLQSFADTNSTTPFVNVFNPATYGKMSQYQLVYTGAGAKTAVQTLTTIVTADKDE